MSNLQNKIASLSASFAADVLRAIQGASLDELTAITGRAATGASPSRGRGGAAAAPAKKAGKGGALRRRSADDIAKTGTAIVALLKKNKSGLRSEQIQKQLGLDKREIPRPLTQLLDEGKIRKVGEKRSTTYFAK